MVYPSFDGVNAGLASHDVIRLVRIFNSAFCILHSVSLSASRPFTHAFGPLSGSFRASMARVCAARRALICLTRKSLPRSAQMAMQGGCGWLRKTLENVTAKTIAEPGTGTYIQDRFSVDA
jgi:hypothetical protein